MGITFALIVILCSILWFYLNRYRNYVNSLDLPKRYGPFTLNLHLRDYRKYMEDGLNKYGKLWVDYIYPTPQIWVADPEIIKEIWVKHFDCFTNRQGTSINNITRFFICNPLQISSYKNSLYRKHSLISFDTNMLKSIFYKKAAKISWLHEMSHLTPSDRRDNFCKYCATMKFLAPFCYKKWASEA